MNTEITKSFDDLETKKIEVTRNGVTQEFLVYELSAVDARRVFDSQKPNGKRDLERAKKTNSRLISASVRRLVNGEEIPITFKEAEAFGTSLMRQLVEHALQLNGLGEDDAGADEKN